MVRPPPGSPLFPYTTLFRSRRERARARGDAARRGRAARLPRAGRGRLARSARDRRGAGQAGPRNRRRRVVAAVLVRSEEHTSELQSLAYLVCRLLLEKKKKN